MAEIMFRPEIYEEVDLGLTDEDTRNYEQKLITTRKEHKCSDCGVVIPAKDKTVVATAFIEAEPMRCYTCIACVEKWLVEGKWVCSDYKTCAECPAKKCKEREQNG